MSDTAEFNDFLAKYIDKIVEDEFLDEESRNEIDAKIAEVDSELSTVETMIGHLKDVKDSLEVAIDKLEIVIGELKDTELGEFIEIMANLKKHTKDTEIDIEELESAKEELESQLFELQTLLY